MKLTKTSAFLTTLMTLGVCGASYGDMNITSVELNMQELPAVPAATACDSGDTSDTSARAFKNVAGNTVVFATAKVNRMLIGSDLKHLLRTCQNVVYQGGNDRDQSKLNDRQWIHSTWTEDGQTVWALVHNEYQGHNHLDLYPQCKGNYQECWRNSVVLAKSTDGGRTFALLPENERRVIDLAYPYVPMVGKPTGFMNPSNMISYGDYIFAFVYNMSYKDQAEGNYLIRKLRTAPWTKASWEIYDRGRFIKIEPTLSQGKTVGKPLTLGVTKGNPLLPFADTTPMKVLSVSKYVQNGKFTGKFVALMSAKAPNAVESWRDGFYIATSYDLINWSAPKQLLSGNLRDTFACALSKSTPLAVYRYGSLLDEETSAQMYSRNFETIGDNPQLFTSRINYPFCGASSAKGTNMEFRKMKVYMSKIIRETNPL